VDGIFGYDINTFGFLTHERPKCYISGMHK